MRAAVSAGFISLWASFFLVTFSHALDIVRLRDLAATQYGPAAVQAVDRWQSMMSGGQDSPIKDKLNTVNVFFNEHIRWMSDPQIYGQEDYWATPLETLARLQADCEDFAIAKYASLLAMGVSSDSLRLVYVKASMLSGSSQAHMVLAWYETPQSVPLILDNINQLLLPASKRTDLKPIFSFNGGGLWIGNSTQPAPANPQARLSRWRTVLEKMRQEGSLAIF
tara:strand:+ start:228 stop:896 length:669 start_codon:yes stop_codon:yes gene_type:complete